MNKSPISEFAETQDRTRKKEYQKEVEGDEIQKQILETLTTISSQLTEILDMLKK